MSIPTGWVIGYDQWTSTDTSWLPKVRSLLCGSLLVFDMYGFRQRYNNTVWVIMIPCRVFQGSQNPLIPLKDSSYAAVKRHAFIKPQTLSIHIFLLSWWQNRKHACSAFATDHDMPPVTAFDRAILLLKFYLALLKSLQRDVSSNTYPNTRKKKCPKCLSI